MTTRQMTVTVKVADLAEVTAALDEAADAVERLTRERDEWEERYDELLSACGGVWPGA